VMGCMTRLKSPCGIGLRCTRSSRRGRRRPLQARRQSDGATRGGVRGRTRMATVAAQCSRTGSWMLSLAGAPGPGASIFLNRTEFRPSSEMPIANSESALPRRVLAAKIRCRTNRRFENVKCARRIGGSRPSRGAVTPAPNGGPSESSLTPTAARGSPVLI
jgi:hypothetical protein